MANELWAFQAGQETHIGPATGNELLSDGTKLLTGCDDGCCEDGNPCIVVTCNTGENKSCCRTAGICDVLSDPLNIDLASLTVQRGTWQIANDRTEVTAPAANSASAILCQDKVVEDMTLTVTTRSIGALSTEGPQVEIMFEDGQTVSVGYHDTLGTLRIYDVTAAVTRASTAFTWTADTDYLLTIVKSAGTITVTLGATTVNYTDNALYDQAVIEVRLTGFYDGEVGAWKNICIEDDTAGADESCPSDCCWYVGGVRAPVSDDTLGGDSDIISVACDAIGEPNDALKLTYVEFETTITVRNCNLETLEIDGRFQIDDEVLDVSVNGNLTGITGVVATCPTGGGGWCNFTLNDAGKKFLVQGDNTIVFRVWNSDIAPDPNYIGLRVEWTGVRGG